ncbi:IS701 family transposase [Streptomyces albidoflavus]|uniref:IS701 family transposase n=1 Tax=Streptomyces koyangensis TaxID=188770 RepID=A0A385DMY4_9ACTN|nr:MULTISPECIES: IS701 family transposase [Streptomyces]WTD01938.1 IS701 family transposase [Streptomyces albidoflavus]AXQ58807.1 IS701 family transposase [Streptomyces koyangensis]AXQ59050.1 IS701 family transposase [Streptomyces koyangensis]AXQ59171.1 IS701 family transposase [Streptomyces koyangensis]AXQ59173.1 IS701 family transposase [Streptomyces koyangensis]
MGGDISEVDARRWSDGLAGLHERFARRFARSESRESALAYMKGLLSPLERKNGWTVAEEAGHGGPDRIQRLLNRIDWDADGVLDDVREYVVEHLADPGGVLIVDDTGFLKKGLRSAGVQRQYSGTAGRTENCQVGVFLAYSGQRGRTLIDRALYLPKSWTDDRVRCRDAGIGDEIEFATKVRLARQMVRRAIEDEVPFRWVTADAGYGYSKGWRYELEQADVFHVVATTRHDTVVTRQALDHPLHDLMADLPRQKWKRRSCGEGAHGPRIYDWARVEVRPWHRPDRKHWVLARRSITDPAKIAYYIAYAPAGATLNELIAVAGARWAIEECFQTAKGQCGLDDYQVRRYQGWHRHVTLAMAVHAYLAVVRAEQLEKGPDLLERQT